MPDNQTQPGVKISDSLWQRFRDDVEARRGSIRGHLSHEVENALAEYLNASEGGDTHDRLRRIEQKLDELEAPTPTDSEADSDGDPDSVSKTTDKRISEIMSDVRERAAELGSKRVPESDVEAAIERNAGTSYKTIRRYKRLLQNQRELFAHPENDNVYFVQAEPFIAFVENGVGTELANDIAEGYGWDWWETHAPDGLLDDDHRGFQ
jgi:hypothetical protein